MDILVAGIITGSTYALIALGVSLVFGVSNIVNFAHGAIFAIGAMLGWFFAGILGLPLWATLGLVIVSTALLGLMIYFFTIKPLAAAPPIAALLATFAVGIILDNLSLQIFSARTRRFPTLLERSNFELFGFRFGTLGIVIIAVALVSTVVLALFLTRTNYGRAIRATAQDSEAAAQMGIPIAKIQALSFIIASALGGVAGVLVGMYYSNVSPTIGFMAGVQGFTAATLGGLGSLPGAIVGGLVLGIAEAFGVAHWGDSSRDLITFGILIGVLWLRPSGFLGKKSSQTSEPMTGTFFGAVKLLRLPAWAWAVIVVAGLTLPLVASDYLLRVGALAFIYALFALSVTIVGGFTGQIVIGQAGALAIGAYTSALLTKAGVPFLAAFVAAGIVAGIISTLLVAPTWRLRGHYVSIATLGVGAFIAALALNLPTITNGSRGIVQIPRPQIFGWSFTSATQMYLLVTVILIVATFAVDQLRRSFLGRTWSAIREDEVAAESSGIHSSGYKSLAYAIGSFIAGLSGSLYAHQVTFIEPGQFDIAMSVLAVTIVVLGGLRAPFGAVLGAIILVAIPELFRFLNDYRLMFYGVVLLLLILLRPQGLWAGKKATRSQV